LQIFQRYGFKVKDYYSLKRLDPAYRVYFQDEAIDVPGQPRSSPSPLRATVSKTAPIDILGMSWFCSHTAGPGDLEGFLRLVKEREPTAVQPLRAFFKEVHQHLTLSAPLSSPLHPLARVVSLTVVLLRLQAETKYSKGVYEWIWKPHTSVSEVFDFGLIKAPPEMDIVPLFTFLPRPVLFSKFP